MLLNIPLNISKILKLSCKVKPSGLFSPESRTHRPAAYIQGNGGVDFLDTWFWLIWAF